MRVSVFHGRVHLELVCACSVCALSCRHYAHCLVDTTCSKCALLHFTPRAPRAVKRASSHPLLHALPSSLALALAVAAWARSGRRKPRRQAPCAVHPAAAVLLLRAAGARSASWRRALSAPARALDHRSLLSPRESESGGAFRGRARACECRSASVSATARTCSSVCACACACACVRVRVCVCACSAGQRQERAEPGTACSESSGRDAESALPLVAAAAAAEGAAMAEGDCEARSAP
jgi:hypothetical protein